MAVNLMKNRLTLLTAYQDVIDETTDTDWALFSYEDDTDDLTLASSGGGGLAQITLTFDISRVMYGFCSLKEATSALPRYILINWVGDDVADARKCACASHVATIADFFQGVEVIVNASSLDDIEPSAVGQRLTNGTTATASPVLSRLRTKEGEELRDVGTVYEKTNAEVEMKKINREEFWEKAKREEELRKEEERRKMAEERQRYEEERMELEKKEQENREKMYREKELQIQEHRKKMQEEEESRERLRNQTTLTAEPSVEDLNLDKKESEVEEAKAIIAQRQANPREFFKQKERAMTFSVDTVSVHRTGRHGYSPFLKQQHSPSSLQAPPLHTPPPHARTQRCDAAAAGDDDDDDEEAASTQPNMAAASPIPKIVTTTIKEDVGGDKDHTDVCGLEHNPLVQDSTESTSKPQTRDSASSDFSVWESGTDSLVNLWDSSVAPPTNPSNSSHTTNLVDLMGDAQDDLMSGSASSSSRPQPLLSFDDMMDGTLCSGVSAEDEPSSLVDVTTADHMTLSYQHALQHASGAEPEQDDGQLLMTNGETLLKEGTQVSEGYFSQSQEEEFVQSEDSSAKPVPVFYNKPPEIDITCWDTDPVVDDDDD